MYAHHKQSIENLAEYFKNDLSVIAVILGGSVAKGCARADSDIDAIVVVTDERYESLDRAHRLSETIYGHCTYEHGYFDIKYVNKAYLTTAAQHGSEPARASFKKSSCVFTRDTEIDTLIKAIPVFQKNEKDKKMLAFYSAFSLNCEYFWSVSKGKPYFRTRVISDIVLFGLRLVLQDREILFPCNNRLQEEIDKLGAEGESLNQKANALLQNGSTEAKADFVAAVTRFTRYEPPQDFAEILTSYTNNHELWWYKHSPVIAEW